MKRIGALSLLLGLGLLPFLALGASTGLTIQPVKISHTLNPGQTASGYISLSNASEVPVQVEVKVEDFIPNAGGDGVRFVARAEGVTTVRDWITLNNNVGEMTLQKGEQTSIPYVITAPADAEPGSHFGVAFFKAIDLAQADQQLKVGTQVGTLIFVTVPGSHLQKGQVLNFKAPLFVQSAPVTFTTTFENTGTVHFEPKGSITIRNLFGSIVAEVPVEGQVVLPTGIKDLQTTLQTDEFLLGRYTASIQLYDGEGTVLSSNERAFYAFPLWYVLGFVAAIAVLFFAFRFLGSRFDFSVKLKK